MALDQSTKNLILGALGQPEAANDLIDNIENIPSEDISDGAVTTAKLGALAVTNAKVAAGIDAVKIGGGAVSNTEFGYLDGVSSALQTQLNAKLALAGGTLTGALLFTDNSFDIGASGLTRPRTGYFGTNVVAGGKALLTGGLGVGNSAAATQVLGAVAVVKKIEVFDASGASLGFLPVYSAIT